jgi:thiol peroxidase
MTRTITFQGAPQTLAGPELKTGVPAPNFLLTANDLSSRSLKDYAGKALLISVVPSLDTSICDTQTRRFNKEAIALAPQAAVLTVSCDLPFAQARWCGGLDAENLQTLSDYKDRNFGLAYGVLINELQLLTRAIFVLNPNHIITYIQMAPEVAREVNYTEALQAVKAAV